MKGLKVFVGSSSEAKEVDSHIRKFLEEYGVIPIPWRESFIPGEFGLESLLRITENCDGAVIIATPDDKNWYRGTEGLTPRDNILFELGLFIKSLGRFRVGLIIVKNIHGDLPRIPTDISGLNSIPYDYNLNAHNERAIAKWIFQLKKIANNNLQLFDDPLDILKESYGDLPLSWKDDIKDYILEPTRKLSIQAIRGEFSLTSGQYYNSIINSLSNSGKNTTIRALNILSTNIWDNNNKQQRYLSYNYKALESGAKIKRLFIINRNISSGIWNTINEQLEKGIDIRVIEPKQYASYPILEDCVIIVNQDDKRSYISEENYDNQYSLKGANLILHPTTVAEQIKAFDSLWDISQIPAPVTVSKIGKQEINVAAPGLSMKYITMSKEVISCQEAAEERGVPLENELKTLIISTSIGFVAAHIPGDGRLSLRAIKNVLQVKEACIASKEELHSLGMSPGTVSAILEPVWSMPNFISKRVLTLDYVTTNNGTRIQYFKFDPIILLNNTHAKMGQFESKNQ